jgi:hypothetical protein
LAFHSNGKQRRRALEIKVLRKIFEIKREDVKVDWKNHTMRS